MSDPRDQDGTDPEELPDGTGASSGQQQDDTASGGDEDQFQG